jgi:multiple sugar transport system substrate-binding protein
MVFKILRVIVVAMMAGFLILFNFAGYGNAAKAKKTIYISHCDTGNRAYLDTAIAQFQKSYPKVQIKVTHYFKSADYRNGTYQEYLKVLNTKLMTGQGADIVYLNRLPYRKYIEKNCFVDLGRFIKKDQGFNFNDYQTNILNGCKVKGKLYTWPVMFSFEVLAANQDILKQKSVVIQGDKLNLNGLAAVAKRVTEDINRDGKPDRYALPHLKPKFLLPYIPAFVNPDTKQARFNSPEFIQLLNTAKMFNDQELAMPPLSDNDTLDALNRGAIVFTDFSIDSYCSISVLRGIFNGKVELLNFAPKGSLGFFSCDNDLYAVSQRTRYKSEAWQFLKLLLSEEIQSGLEGLTVNKKAQRKFVSRVMGQKMFGSINGRNMALDPLTQEDTDRINRLIQRLRTNYYSDTTLNELITRELTEFFDDKKNAKETAKIIQNKVSIYLGE